MNVKLNNQLEYRLRTSHTLPTLPAVAMQVIHLARDPDVSYKLLSQTISRDAALSAKMLRVANSPLYSMRRKIDDIRQAITLLGLDATMTIALSFSLIRSFSPTGDEGSINYDTFWRRSLISGAACRAISEKLQISNPEQFFIAGVLQDIGILILDAALKDEYADIVSAVQDHDDWRAAEERALGADHTQVGAWIMGKWKISERLQKAVLYSHTSRPLKGVGKEEDIQFYHAVALSGRISDAWMHKNRELVIHHATGMAQMLLKMSTKDFRALLSSVAAEIHTLSTWLELDLMEADFPERLLDQAAELQMLRNVDRFAERPEME